MGYSLRGFVEKVDMSPSAYVHLAQPSGERRARVDMESTGEMDPEIVRVVVGEAHTVLRRGLVTLLNRDRGIGVVGEAGDGWSVVGISSQLDPDIVLLSVDLPRLNGIDAARHIKRNNQGTKVLLLSPYNTGDEMTRYLDAGVDGCLSHDCTVDYLYASIRELHAATTRFAPAQREAPVQPLLREREWSMPPRHPGHDARLTSREREVLQLIAEGHTHREAAAILHVSSRTVDTHANHIMQKLDLHDPARLTAYAVTAGLIFLPHR